LLISVTFIDRIVNLDAEGKALDPVRIATLTIPAKMKGSETRGTILCAPMSLTGLFWDLTASPSKPAPIWRERFGSTRWEPRPSKSRGNSGPRTAIPSSFRCSTTPGKVEAKLYSAVKPEFYRIYRSEQSTDVVRSATADRVQKVVFKASGPKLSPLFDGSEQLIGVTSNPWYTRQTFLPAS
jgi:hypothetical protein